MKYSREVAILLDLTPTTSTTSGNLKDMFQHIAAVGNDVLVQGSKQCGSILVENMTVAGR